MTRADICIPRILAHEGGWADNPHDNGGPTNRGITLATYRRYIKRNGTKEDLRNLTEAEAVAVYKAQYWDRVQADRLPVGLDYAVADFAVNSGPTRAAKFLQRIVGAEQDGFIGPVTLAAVQNRDASALILRLCDERLSWLKRLSDWRHFGIGWTNRVQRVRADALADAEPSQPQPNPTPAPQPSGFWAALLRVLRALFSRKV